MKKLDPRVAGAKTRTRAQAKAKVVRVFFLPFSALADDDIITPLIWVLLV